MIRRVLLSAVVAAVVLVACGGSSDGGVATPTTKLTLLPTTTTTQPPATTVVPDTAAPVESTTTTATPITAPTTAVAVETTVPPTTIDPVIDALTLSDQGIGAAVFSGEPEGVVAYLSTFIGQPTADSGWVDPFSISACSGSELRVVSWGSLRLTFGDVSPVLQGRRHFFAFTYGSYAYDGVSVASGDQSPPGLITSDGVGLGTTLVDLEVAHPSVAFNPSDSFLPATFVINDNLRGALNGLADQSIVVEIVGGQDCADPT